MGADDRPDSLPDCISERRSPVTGLALRSSRYISDSGPVPLALACLETNDPLREQQKMPIGVRPLLP